MNVSPQYRAVLLENAAIQDGPVIEIILDARDFDHAEELTELMARSIGYTIEQVSEV